MGGTSGIGEYAMKTFAKYAKSPRIYFVGRYIHTSPAWIFLLAITDLIRTRNETAASRLQEEIHKTNPTATTTFVKADLSTLSGVDEASLEIRRKEKKINLLFLSSGIFNFNGRDENKEGLDKKMTLHYYGRIRFTLNFLPMLKAAAAEDKGETSSTPVGARVFSILGPGIETRIDEDDFELKRTFTTRKCSGHSTAFTSFAFETLANQNPEIGWLHVWPSLVLSGFMRDLSWWTKMGIKALAPFAVSHEDSGEGMVHLMSDEKWKTGLALVSYDGSDRDSRKASGLFATKDWWSEGRRDLVWRHTCDVLGRVPRITSP